MPITLRHDAAAVVPPSNQTTRKYGQSLVLQQQRQNFNVANQANQQAFDMERQYAADLDSSSSRLDNYANEALKNPDLSPEVRQQLRNMMIGKAAVLGGRGYDSAQRGEYISGYNSQVAGLLSQIPPQAPQPKVQIPKSFNDAYAADPKSFDTAFDNTVKSLTGGGEIEVTPDIMTKAWKLTKDAWDIKNGLYTPPPAPTGAASAPAAPAPTTGAAMNPGGQMPALAINQPPATWTGNVDTATGNYIFSNGALVNPRDDIAMKSGGAMSNSMNYLQNPNGTPIQPVSGIVNLASTYQGQQGQMPQQGPQTVLGQLAPGQMPAAYQGQQAQMQAQPVSAAQPATQAPAPIDLGSVAEDGTFTKNPWAGVPDEFIQRFNDNKAIGFAATKDVTPEQAAQYYRNVYAPTNRKLVPYTYSNRAATQPGSPQQGPTAGPAQQQVDPLIQAQQNYDDTRNLAKVGSPDYTGYNSQTELQNKRVAENNASMEAELERQRSGGGLKYRQSSTGFGTGEQATQAASDFNNMAAAEKAKKDAYNSSQDAAMAKHSQTMDAYDTKTQGELGITDMKKARRSLNKLTGQYNAFQKGNPPSNRMNFKDFIQAKIIAGELTYNDDVVKLIQKNYGPFSQPKPTADPGSQQQQQIYNRYKTGSENFGQFRDSRMAALEEKKQRKYGPQAPAQSATPTVPGSPPVSGTAPATPPVSGTAPTAPGAPKTPKEVKGMRDQIGVIDGQIQGVRGQRGNAPANNQKLKDLEKKKRELEWEVQKAENDDPDYPNFGESIANAPSSDAQKETKKLQAIYNGKTATPEVKSAIRIAVDPKATTEQKLEAIRNLKAAGVI